MSTLIKRIVNEARIEPELSSLVVADDGSVRTAHENEELTGSETAIRAVPDMLPVPLDSPLRTWGVFSLGGYWVGEYIHILT